MAQSADGFVELLPLLRCIFGTFSGLERRQLAERAAAGETRERVRHVAGGVDIDHARAMRVLPILRTILRGAAAQEALHDECA